MSGHFVVGFLNRDVEKEYQKLDGSQRRLVRIAVAKLKTRADEIGTPLHGTVKILSQIDLAVSGPVLF